jgi:hypothetical protein
MLVVEWKFGSVIALQHDDRLKEITKKRLVRTLDLARKPAILVAPL